MEKYLFLKKEKEKKDVERAETTNKIRMRKRYINGDKIIH